MDKFSKFCSWQILFILLISTIAFGQTVTGDMEQFDDLTIYFFSSDKEVTIAWDAPVDQITTSYDFYLWHMVMQSKMAIGNTPTPTITFRVPRSGPYTFYTRSVRSPLEQSTIDWINSVTDKTQLKNWAFTSFVCDIADWWSDTATLDEMKAKIKEVNRYCSGYVASSNKDNSQVTLKSDGSLVNKGWILFGYVAPPTGGGITK